MDSAGRMQSQLRQNNEELLDYLKGLEGWEEEMREKDQTLVKNRSILKENLPPVRSSVTESRKPKKKKKQNKREPVEPASRIHSYDYKAWDKFDVEKACEDVDYEVGSSSGEEEEGEEEEVGKGGRGEDGGGSASSDEEEMERQRAMAVAEKEKGNVLYKEGEFEAAVECYSKGMMLDPLSAALPANRALTLLKLERYAAVEEDCNTALALEDDYVKAFLRRGVARRHLGKLTQAVHDFEQVLKLEPKNKQAAAELQIAKRLKEEEDRKRLTAEGHVFPVKRPVHQRSKKPLKRIAISDIAGTIAATDIGSTVSSTQTCTDTGKDARLGGHSAISNYITTGSQTSTMASGIGSAQQTNTSTSAQQTNTSTSAQQTNTSTSAQQTNTSTSAQQTNTSTSAQETNTSTSAQQTNTSTSVQISTSDIAETDSTATTHRPIPSPTKTAGETGGDRVTVDSTSASADGDDSRSRSAVGGGGDVGGDDELPPVPETTFQFQSDWKRLRHNWPLLISYFKQLPPARYPVLLQQSLETTIFSDIISILRTTPGCVEELTWLTRVQRFSVAVMFLSKTDKNNVQGLFTDLVTCCSTDCERDSLKKLSSKFGVIL